MPSTPHDELLPPMPQPPGTLALRREGALSTRLIAREDGGAATGDKIDLREIWRTLVKHKWTILGVTALCTLAAAVYTLRMTPQYESTTLLQIDRAAQKVLGFNTEVAVDEGPTSDQLQLQTQIELLKSRSLAERVIDELGLYRPENAEAVPASPAPVDALPGTAVEAAEPGMVDQMLGNLRTLFMPSHKDQRVLDKAGVVAAFNSSVTVAPVRNSRLVEIRVLNSDPELAARIANTLAKTYIATSVERKVDSSAYARQYLEDQIKQSKAKLEESERQINAYAKRNEILNLGERGSAATQNFVDFSAALAKASQDRIKAEALYNEVRLNPESAPQALDNRAIQTYKERRAQLEAEYAKNLSVLKPDFPTMVQARAQITELDTRIKTEVNNILASIKGQYEAAKSQEELLKTRVGTTREEVITVQDRSVDMNLLQRELETNRLVHDSLLQRLKEVSVAAGITSNNVSIVDEATAPLFPSKPKPVVNVGLGVMLGLFLGMLVVLLREQLDDSLKHADEIETQFRLPLLGLIPFTKPDKGSAGALAMLAYREPRSAFAESYRSMRTALQFSTADGAPKRFMVTSCGKSEGKTTTALALAINFAQLGQRVLLIDADMRKGVVHKMLNQPNEKGLSNLLSGDQSGDGMIQTTAIPNLCVITAGPTPPDPVELLMGPKLGLLLEKAQEMGFAQVVIDGPPLLGIADAVVLGNQVQHIVFTVKAGETRKESLKTALRRLRNAGLAPMGVVLTHVRNEHANDFAYEAYYGEAQGPRTARAGVDTQPADGRTELPKPEQPTQPA